MDVSELEMLIDGIKTELPFPPPFQYKKFGHAPFPQIFDEDVTCSAQLNQDTFLKELCSYSIGDRSPLAV